MQWTWIEPRSRAFVLAVTVAVSAFPAAAGAAPFPAYGGAPTDALKPRAVAGVPAHVTLEQAIAIAAATSPSVEAARGPLHLASAGTETARVGTRPTFNGTGQLSQPASFPNGSSGATFTLSQLVYDGGLVMSNIRAARSSEDAARQTYRRALQTLTNNVAQAYFGALAAEAQTALAQVIVNQGLAQERLISAQIDAGTAAQIDLQTAHAATLQAQGKVVTSQSQEVVALAQFAHALGLPADADVHPQPTPSSGRASTLPGGTPLKYDVAVATALTLRPDYLSAIRSVDAGQQKVRSARLGNRPSVTGSAAHSFTQQQAGFPQQSPAVQWLASVKVPLYDGGLTAANTATARAQLEEAVAAERLQEQTVQVDVRTALAQLISAQALLRVNDDSVELARRLLGGRQAQYRAGKPVLELYLNAQANYAAAQNAQLSALYALRQAEQAYLYALGKNEVVQAT